MSATATPAKSETKTAPKASDSSKAPDAPASKSIALPARTVTNVKGIKNSLFADLPIGESVVVGGTIRSLVDKPGQYGDYTEFKGDFGCVHNGQVFRAQKLFLPALAADTLKNQYLDTLETNGAIVGTTKATALKIEFKIQLMKVKDDSPRNKNGFQWNFKNLLETAPESDKVLALLD